MQLLTFTLNGIEFGIAVNDVVSIETRMNIVSVPESPANIRGIINLHGEIVPIYSLANRFGYGNQEIENVVVAGVGGMKVGLEVGRVKEILEVQDSNIINMPEIMNAAQNCFHNIASNQKELIVLLDVAKLVTTEEQKGIRKMIEDQSK